jgi:fumarate hydratase, class II
LNSFEDFSDEICEEISKETKIKFKSSSNKFESLSSNDALVFVHSSLNNFAASFMKIANDIRFLGMGPRCVYINLINKGIKRIIITRKRTRIINNASKYLNSHKGKVNPTQCESVTMLCCQVMGNNTAVTIAGSNGHFQLNVFKPVIISNVIRSIRLLSDSCISFVDNCLEGIVPNEKQINEYVRRCLMLVTALNPVIGIY